MKLILSPGMEVVFLETTGYDLFWIVNSAVDWLFESLK